MTYKNKTAADFLRRVATNPRKHIEHRCVGICYVLNHNLDISCMAKKRIQVLMKRWPEYSGDPAYPIPSYDLYRTPRDKYLYGIHDDRHWDRRTKYGRARIRLAFWLADQIDPAGARK